MKKLFSFSDFFSHRLFWEVYECVWVMCLIDDHPEKSCWWVWRDKHIKRDEKQKDGREEETKASIIFQVLCWEFVFSFSVLLTLGANRETFLRISSSLPRSRFQTFCNFVNATRRCLMEKSWSGAKTASDLLRKLQTSQTLLRHLWNKRDHLVKHCFVHGIMNSFFSRGLSFCTCGVS